MQNVFITGGSSGIGLALAKEYAAQGACLGLLARRQDVLEAVRAALPNPERHYIYAVDVTDHAALAQAAIHFNQVTGGAHCVIANAGISRGTLTEFEFFLRERSAPIPEIRSKVPICGFPP